MNMTMHDYAGCERAPCVRCHDYGLGWARAKSKAHEEVVQVASRAVILSAEVLASDTTTPLSHRLTGHFLSHSNPCLIRPATWAKAAAADSSGRGILVVGEHGTGNSIPVLRRLWYGTRETDRNLDSGQGFEYGVRRNRGGNNAVASSKSDKCTERYTYDRSSRDWKAPPSSRE